MLEKVVNDLVNKKLVFLVAMIMGGCFFSCSATYATAPYLNFSSGSGGTVSFDKVQPSSTGEPTTASDTLTINTNCTVGYSVYVSATSTGDTNLTNSSAASDNIIAASSATVGGTSAVLSPDTWGINSNSTEAAAGRYFGLPTYAAAMDEPLAVKTSAATTTTVTIYYGAKVTTAVAPGTYEGDVLYTVLPNPNCTHYAVSFNANGGTGTMNNQTITVGEATALTSNSFTRTNYTFLGWSTSPNGKTGTATDGIGTAADVDYTDGQSVTDIADFNTTLPLYAIWRKTTYTLTVNNGNTTAINSITITNNTKGGTISSGASVEWGDSITVACTPKSGYKCTGWTSSNTGLVPSSTNASYTFTMPQGAITLTGNGESDVVYMQGWTCSSSGLSTGQQVTLRDKRDNHDYTVKKLPDGKCWMTQNLTLGDSNSTAAQRTLTSANTNVSSGTYYLPPAGKQGSITSSSTLTSTTAANFSTSNDNQAKTQFRTKNTSYTNDSDTGYYNFYTATLGFSYYNDGKTSGSSSNDICPSGWRLPKTTDSGTNVTTTGSANDFTYLARQYSTSGWSGSATGTSGYGYYNNTDAVKGPMYTSAAANGNNYAGFSYAGYWDGTNTSASSVGSYGYYWSSSVYYTGRGYYLYFSSSGVRPQYYYFKYYGRAVRCIAKS